MKMLLNSVTCWDSFDLKQHVTKPTNGFNHILDLVITTNYSLSTKTAFYFLPTGTRKKLFSTFGKLVDKNQDDQLPEHQSDKELADRFAYFFVDKVESIMNSFSTMEESSLTLESDPLFW